jgi:ppGpp synthetase/RelA/SpoT-type nucleotidyltranferase
MSFDVTSLTEPAADFDFAAHRVRAAGDYRGVRPLYADFAACVQGLLERALHGTRVKVASVEARAKDVESFTVKAATPSVADPRRPKYPDPLRDITDLAGIRVITFFPRTIEDVDRVIRAELDVVEVDDKGDALDLEERFGYDSVHYLVRLTAEAAALIEHRRFAGLVGEIQVRTILQHAWAEIEHDIRYKSPEAIPASIRRRFMSLAGMLEIADREFQAIQDADQKLRRAARQSIAEGRLAEVELGPDALKVYLDRRLGPDGRISESNYETVVALLRELGFANLQQVEDCIGDLDDRAISRQVWGAKQGQLTRFEGLLLTAMGERFLERHPWRHLDWFVAVRREWLRRLHEADVPVGDCGPPADR